MEFHDKLTLSIAEAARNVLEGKKQEEVKYPHDMYKGDDGTVVKEEAIEEAIGSYDILVMKEPARLDPTRLIPSFQYKPASILRALKKAANDNTKPALQGAYIDGESIVHNKTSKTIANFKLGGTFKQLLSDVEKWAEKNAELFAPKAPKAPKPTIDRSTDTRVIITATDDQAIAIKKAIHNSKTKTMVRIMKRKDGSKVYIDTADNASLETAIKAAEKLLSQNEAVESLDYEDLDEAKTPSARAQFNDYVKAYGIKAHGMNNPKEAEKVLKFIFNAYKGKLTPEAMHDLVAKGFFEDGIKANLAGKSNDFESIIFNGNKWIQQFDYAAYIKKKTGLVKESLAEESDKKKRYQAFFQKALKKFGVKTPAELEGDKKKEFFDYVDAGYEADNEED